MVVTDADADIDTPIVITTIMKTITITGVCGIMTVTASMGGIAMSDVSSIEIANRGSNSLRSFHFFNSFNFSQLFYYLFTLLLPKLG